MKAYAITVNGKITFAGEVITQSLAVDENMQKDLVANMNKNMQTDRYGVVEVEVREVSATEERDRVTGSLVFALALTLILVIMIFNLN